MISHHILGLNDVQVSTIHSTRFLCIISHTYIAVYSFVHPVFSHQFCCSCIIDWLRFTLPPAAQSSDSDLIYCIVFITTATAIRSLGHGLRTVAAVPKSTIAKPFTLHGTVKWLSAYGPSSRNKLRWSRAKDANILLGNVEICHSTWLVHVCLVFTPAPESS